MTTPKLTPAARALAEHVADLTAAKLAPMLRELVDEALADWSPTCVCPEPLATVEDDESRCVKCGRRST